MANSSEKNSDSSPDDHLRSIDEIEQKWNKFRRALKADERKFFDDMFKYGKIHRKAGEVKEGSKDMDIFLMSVILEQQLQIMRLKKKLDEID